MRKTCIIAILVLLLAVSCASAAFTYEVVSVTDQIFPGTTAQFELYVKNTGTETDEVKLVFSKDTAWSVITSPIFHQTKFSIAPGEQIKTDIYLTPSEKVKYGRQYTYGLEIVSLKDSFKKEVGLDLFLRDPFKQSNYVPIVEVDVDIDSETDPRKETILSILLTNFNPLNISELLIVIESEVNTENNREAIVQLEGLEKKKYEFTINYDPLQIPKNDRITVKSSVPSRNVTFNPKVKTIQILPYNDIKEDIDVKEEFLKKRYEVKYYNDGNVGKIKIYRMKTSIFKNIFTSSKPNYEDVLEDGYRYLQWNVDMGAQESKTISIEVNYRPLFIILVFLLASVILYYILRSAVIVKKQAVRTSEGDDSSKVKVLLHIKNRTSKPVENVKVLDKVPAIAVINKDFPVGTLQPAKVITHEKKGTIVKWVIPTLEAYEERIVTYYLTSKLKIIGGMRLPAAMIKFKNKIGRFSKVYSNKTSSE